MYVSIVLSSVLIPNVDETPSWSFFIVTFLFVVWNQCVTFYGRARTYMYCRESQFFLLRKQTNKKQFSCPQLSFRVSTMSFFSLHISQHYVYQLSPQYLQLIYDKVQVQFRLF